MQVKIAVVGKKSNDRKWVGLYLSKTHNFKKMRIEAGLAKFLRNMYGYTSQYVRIPWELKLDMYDAIYKVDNDIHINHLLRCLSTTDKDVVVDDVRYANELLKLKEHGFKVVRITTPLRKKVTLKGLGKAAKNSIKLNEYFGTNFDLYSVDYSVYFEEADKAQKAIDKIVDALRRDLVSSDEGEIPINLNSEDDYENQKEERPLNKDFD